MCKCKQCGGIINKDQIFCSLECEEIWKRDHFRWFFKSSSSFCNKYPNERLSYNKCCWSCIKEEFYRSEVEYQNALYKAKTQYCKKIHQFICDHHLNEQLNLESPPFSPELYEI